jgi:hypothetical protein
VFFFLSRESREGCEKTAFVAFKKKATKGRSLGFVAFGYDSGVGFQLFVNAQSNFKMPAKACHSFAVVPEDEWCIRQDLKQHFIALCILIHRHSQSNSS